MNITYHLQFEALCHICNLGKIVTKPQMMSGGLMHRMFAIETTKGKYAVKALNPQIMARSSAHNNYVRSEQIAEIVSTCVPALPAQIIENRCIHHIDNQFYLVFDWLDGATLKPNKINEFHCKKLGSILADIHKTDFSQIQSNRNIEDIKEIDWQFYWSQGENNHAVWANLLYETMEQLYIWNEKVRQASGLLASETVISHRDLDPKNVMWKEGEPVIIDWESAGEIHPGHDVVETAIYWSMNETGKIEEHKFLRFIEAYHNKIGKVNTDWEAVLSLGFLSKLDWLEYSLKRSLRIECADDNEQEMGTMQVTDTINALTSYAEMIPTLHAWLRM